MVSIGSERRDQGWIPTSANHCNNLFRFAHFSTAAVLGAEPLPDR
jgi:hypothetical protein